MQNCHPLFKAPHARFWSQQGRPVRRTSTVGMLLLPLLSWMLSLVVPLQASAGVPPAAGLPDMPLEYGKVIYRVNESSPKQLYIIGISHRDPETGRNGDTTIKTQAEIYRIGEWLHRNRELQLLLPEGYFNIDDSCPPVLSAVPAHENSLDSALLTQKLADESRFVNAEMLLRESCRLRVSQVEDRNIYNAVFRSLRSLKANGAGQPSAQERLARLQYLQEVRTAVLLQNIPEVVDSELNNGRIHKQTAMFTIGLNHLQDIVRYFQDNAIKINAPGDDDSLGKSYSSELNLLKTGYGVTVIIPRTLADDRRLLQMTNLDRILIASGRTGAEGMR